MSTSLSARLDLNDLIPHGLVDLAEGELLNQLALLQQAFTQERGGELFESYGQDPKKVTAYFLFYTPTNMSKFWFLWDQLDARLREYWATCSFVDIGSGPGTYSLAFLMALPSEYRGTLRLIDKSPLMLEQAKKVIKALFPEVRLECYSSLESYLKAPERERDFLFFGHSLNEMNELEKQRILGTKRPVAWIEPGTPEVFQNLIPWRERLIQQGHHVIYPCLGAGDCPARSLAGEWCHQVVRTAMAPGLARLAQILQLNRHELPMLAHVYLGPGSELITERRQSESLRARVVRTRKQTKHSFEWEVCFEREGELQWLEVSLPKRGLSKPQVKKLETISMGEEICFEPIKKLSEKLWRIRLIS